MSDLHKYTQEEFDAIPAINGEKRCPTGDYSDPEKTEEYMLALQLAKLRFSRFASLGEQA